MPTKIKQMEEVTVWLWREKKMNQANWIMRDYPCHVCFSAVSNSQLSAFSTQASWTTYLRFALRFATQATENTNSSIHAFEYTTTISRKLEAVVEFNFFFLLFSFFWATLFIWFVVRFFFFSVDAVDQVHGIAIF